MLSGLWIFLEAMLFVLIGAQIDVTHLNAPVIGYGLLIMGIAWLVSLIIQFSIILLQRIVVQVRFVVTGLTVTGAGLSWKEIISLAIAWLPKATVQVKGLNLDAFIHRNLILISEQAALGPVALEIAEEYNADRETKDLALIALNLAALSILITAPLGALALQFGAPRLLAKPPRTESAQEPNSDLQVKCYF